MTHPTIMWIILMLAMVVDMGHLIKVGTPTMMISFLANKLMNVITAMRNLSPLHIAMLVTPPRAATRMPPPNNLARNSTPIHIAKLVIHRRTA